jgi:DNA-binding FadR family transcriptional regulator
MGKIECSCYHDTGDYDPPADEVRDRLLAMIRGGEFQPGDRLPPERARVAVPDTRNMFDRIGWTMLHLLQTSPKTREDLKDALESQRAARENTSEFMKRDMAFHSATPQHTAD